MRPMGVAVACRLRPHAEMEGSPLVAFPGPLLVDHHFKILAFARCTILIGLFPFQNQGLQAFGPRLIEVAVCHTA